MTAVLAVRQGGLLSTVQDLGRPHAARYGVPPGGALDRFALVAANQLLNNADGAAALELTAGGAAFEVLAPAVLAITGADLGARLDDQPLLPWSSFFARAGQQLRFERRQEGWGAHAYLAVGGGIDVPMVLGSRSTNLSAAFGGLHGRSLRPGDLLASGDGKLDVLPMAGRQWPQWARPRYTTQPTLGILPGPHLDLFAADALVALAAGSWQIGLQSNRIGYRLEGSVLPLPGQASIVSHGVVPGAIQVPPDGAPILLMADAQTTGGYPVIAMVIGADLPLAAQLLPGDRLRFGLRTRDEALAARRLLHDWLQQALPDDELVQQLALAGA